MEAPEKEVLKMFLDGCKITDIYNQTSVPEELIKDIVIKHRSSKIINFTNDVDFIKDYGIYVQNGISNIQKLKNDEHRKKINTIIQLSEDGMSMTDVGKVFNLTRERVRQILNKYAPEIIVVNEIKKFKICDECKKEKKYVYKRGGGKLICDSCSKKIQKINKEKWSKNYDHCIDCKTTDKPHLIRGRCERCHKKYLYHNDPEYKTSHDKSQKKWIKHNKDKIRENNKKYYLSSRYTLYNGNGAMVLSRDKYRCTVCGVTEAQSLLNYKKNLFIVHLGSKENHAIDNMVTMCKTCFGKHQIKYMHSKLPRGLKKNFKS